MTKLLYIEASPRKNRSASNEIGAAFVDAYLNQHPMHKVKTINLWHYDLPEMSGELLKSVYSSILKLELTHKEEKEWYQIEKIVNEFKDADKYLLSTPMWNFSVPYRLKHYLDVIIQPGLTYEFSPKTGYRGLVTGKPIAIISSRGGEYVRHMQKLDMLQPYLDQVLKSMGFQDIRHILVQPTLDSSLFATQAAVKEAREVAMQQARAMGAAF